MGRQKLTDCRQKESESVAAYAEKVSRAVTSATVGLSEQTFKEILTEEILKKKNFFLIFLLLG